jgi:hypothetical protein
MAIDQVTDSDILAELELPEDGSLSDEAARALLQWRFTERAAARMTALAERNSRGTISEAELDELHRYLRVGALVNLVQAKARKALKSGATTDP